MIVGAGDAVTDTNSPAAGTTYAYEALGRISSIVEDPGAVPHLNATTDYCYDVPGDLVLVNQAGKFEGSTIRIFYGPK